MLPRSIARLFSAPVRARGDDYALRGAVEILEAGAAEITAVVRGSDAYDVRIAVDDAELTMACTCPFARDAGACKHMWATLVAADGLKLLGRLFVQDDATPAYEFARVTSERPTADARRQPRPPRAPEWKSMLDRARRGMVSAPLPGDVPAGIPPAWPDDRQIVYVLDVASTMVNVGVVIEVASRRRQRDGTLADPKGLPPEFAARWPFAPNPQDRRIAQMLIGALGTFVRGMPRGPFVLTGAGLATTLPAICATGRCFLRDAAGQLSGEPLMFDDGPPWSFGVTIARDGRGFLVEGRLRRGDEQMSLADPSMLHAEGVLLHGWSIARFDHADAWALVRELREMPRITVAERELPSLLEGIYTLPRRPEVQLPSDAHVTEIHAEPQPGVVIHDDSMTWRGSRKRLEPFFLYGPERVSDRDARATLFDTATLTVRHRNARAEQRALATLAKLGASSEWDYARTVAGLAINANKVQTLILELARRGWHVEAEGALYRAPGEARAAVSSGIDWFDLSAGVRYGEMEASLPDLLAASRSGSTTVALADGSRGIIPTDWLARIAPIAAGGVPVDGGVRFRRSQTALLDALLTTVAEPDVDAMFERARAELAAFERVAPHDPPPTFQGTLRDYQREGLGWLHFLRTFGLGGCLADDMGLGKTIQVLALLDARIDDTSAPRLPSIVVVPRSLVFNWLAEARRFAPRLRVLDFSGLDRRAGDIHVDRCDVVLTTYGTLRRDAAMLAGLEFDYVILDEAQAIKTGSSASAKAARLLRGRHRLALTGTPIENRLEELWSLFEFLNPGMLGASTTFSALARVARGARTDSGIEDTFARALRPVMLRRTKARVAAELPARVEQTLHVELEGAQRKYYDALLASYRQSVSARVERDGVSKTRMHILEALLRLRQAACHPALVDERKRRAPSAKLDALVPALGEVVAGGHKALVFSQFTSFLALVRERLDAASMRYEYLDGQTRDRQARVERFQQDAECPVFLISLKAGGHGLNLTAAEYVFILDPWWNPAVEAQAIDRAHRIGQSNRVMATRIVARDTIEEKILELQASKRALAEAILGGERGGLAGIGREELELLLG